MTDVCIIAEISANHGSSIDIVKQTIVAAKQAGANAVKIQTYTADTITLNSNKPDFTIRDGSIWDGRNLYDLYKEGSFPFEWHSEIFKFARKQGIVLFSTPFDKTAVDLLESLDNPIYKIASFEITDIPLITYVAKRQKPIIMSTGIATFEEIENAVNACKLEGNHDITLLKCTSQYPSKVEDANIATMVDMAKQFQVKVGLSDHTIGSLCPIVATSLGATVIEKHFILDRKVGGPDSSFSMLPDEFEHMVTHVRNAQLAVGIVDYSIDEKRQGARNFRRSLYIAESVQKGECVTTDNVRSVRPGYGLEPKYLPVVLGRKFVGDFEKGEPFSLTMIEDENI